MAVVEQSGIPDLSEIKIVGSFEEFLSTKHNGRYSLIAWERSLSMDFNQLACVLGKVADPKIDDFTKEEFVDICSGVSFGFSEVCAVIMDDMQIMSEMGAKPYLRIIRPDYYQREHPDVLEFHSDTGNRVMRGYTKPGTELLPYAWAELDPVQCKKNEGLVFKPKCGHRPFSLSLGAMWKQAGGDTDLPLPHRGFEPQPGQPPRLLLVGDF